MTQPGDAADRPDLLGTLLVGKPEIAELARVRRPVVTMWIARHRSKPEPFPSPVVETDGRELYRGVDVADWIAARNLGNNPALREDLAAHAVLQAGPEAHTFPPEGPERHSALMTLLSLRAALGEPLGGRGAQDLVTEARQVDPHDRFLAGEVEALADRLPELAWHVDLLVDAAYGPGPAFAALLRRSRRSTPHGGGPLTDRLPGLVGALGAALVDGIPSPRILDAAPHDAGLLLAIGDALPEDAAPEFHLGGDDTPGARLTRRHMLAAGLSLDLHGTEGDGAVGTAATAHAAAPGREDAHLVLVRLPEIPAGTSPLGTLTRLAAHCADLPADARGLIIGPAAVLTDRLADGNVDALRWNLLREDRVRCVARLPEGLLPSRPGVALALWAVGPDRDLAADERWMTIADLSAVHLDAAVTDALVTDVLASLGSYAEANLHAFRFARIVRTAGVIARGAMLPVPPPTVAPGRTIGAADAAVTIQLAADVLGEHQPEPPPGIRVQANAAPRARLVPAGRLAASRALRMVPGTRIAPAHLGGDGAVAVIGPDEIHGRTRIGVRRIDRLVFTSEYPRASYTEPGDVVLCTAPRPGALVDTEGSHAVLAPARILRISDPATSGLVPELVAERLRRLVPDRKPAGSIRATAGWRTWLLPVLDPETVPGTGAALAQLDAHRRALADRLAAVDDLMQTLTVHLTDGVITAEPAPESAGRARQRTGKR